MLKIVSINLEGGQSAGYCLQFNQCKVLLAIKTNHRDNYQNLLTQVLGSILLRYIHRGNSTNNRHSIELQRYRSNPHLYSTICLVNHFLHTAYWACGFSFLILTLFSKNTSGTATAVAAETQKAARCRLV